MRRLEWQEQSNKTDDQGIFVQRHSWSPKNPRRSLRNKGLVAELTRRLRSTRESSALCACGHSKRRSLLILVGVRPLCRNFAGLRLGPSELEFRCNPDWL